MQLADWRLVAGAGILAGTLCMGGLILRLLHASVGAAARRAGGPLRAGLDPFRVVGGAQSSAGAGGRGLAHRAAQAPSRLLGRRAGGGAADRKSGRGARARHRHAGGRVAGRAAARARRVDVRVRGARRRRRGRRARGRLALEGVGRALCERRRAAVARRLPRAHGQLLPPARRGHASAALAVGVGARALLVDLVRRGQRAHRRHVSHGGGRDAAACRVVPHHAGGARRRHRAVDAGAVRRAGSGRGGRARAHRRRSQRTRSPWHFCITWRISCRSRWSGSSSCAASGCRGRHDPARQTFAARNDNRPSAGAYLQHGTSASPSGTTSRSSARCSSSCW